MREFEIDRTTMLRVYRISYRQAAAVQLPTRTIFLDRFSPRASSRGTTRIKGGGVYRLSRFMLISRYPAPMMHCTSASRQRNLAITTGERGNLDGATSYHGEVYHSVQAYRFKDRVITEIFLSCFFLFSLFLPSFFFPSFFFFFFLVKITSKFEGVDNIYTQSSRYIARVRDPFTRRSC